MAAWRSSFIAPFVYPLYPQGCGKLRFVTDLGKFFQYKAAAGYTGALTIQKTVFSAGAVLREENQVVQVKDGVPEIRDLVSEYDGPEGEMGYVEFAISAESSIFDRPLFENGYGLIQVPGKGPVSVIESPKFADPRIIEQIREIGTYCISHTCIGIDPEHRREAFLLLINPYDRALVVRLANQGAENFTVRLPAHTAQNVSLRPLIGAHGWATVMLTAKQRVIAYEACTPYGRPHQPNSIDHLDPYRGEWAIRAARPGEYVRYVGRATLRKLGIIGL